MTTETYLKDRQIAERYGVHPKTVWRWAAQGRFPQPVKLAPGCTRWKSSDVSEWESERNGEVAQ